VLRGIASSGSYGRHYEVVVGSDNGGRDGGERGMRGAFVTVNCTVVFEDKDCLFLYISVRNSEEFADSQFLRVPALDPLPLSCKHLRSTFLLSDD
jgi:hypothetical protein